MSSLDLREEENVLVVSFTKAKILDETTIEQIGKELMEAIGKAPDQKIVLNFGGVSFMSSAMIGKLVLFNNKCKAADVKLKLCGISDNVIEVFKITKLNKVFDIQKTEEKAIASFEKRGWFG
ncbi:MAG: STAS domain-containing protein [Planctomycetes bacterium]|nr:STAS domain-containing protein [Planctomycetota bacterium]